MYDPNGVSSTIRTPTGGGLIPKVEVTDIERAGDLDIPGWHRHAKEVIGVDGNAPTISSQANNLKTKILIENEDEKDTDRVIYEGEFTSTRFIEAKRVMSKNGISVTITSAHGHHAKVIL